MGKDIIYINNGYGERKRVHIEQFQDMIARIFPSDVAFDENNKRILSRTVTFQVTDNCNLACSYCYQINKGKRKLKFEDAKKLIDMLLDEDPKLNNYIDVEHSPALIIEFIGGEPFLEIELIDQIVDYFKIQTTLRHHPWATRFCISICSNGVLYFDPRVQKFLEKNKYNMSFSVTIDGDKELHDSCRLFPNGNPSYDIAMAAADDWMAKGNYMGSKITIAPGNISRLYKAIVHMVERGYTEINANVVYEKGWELEHTKIYYEQLKKIADYWEENNLYDTIFLSLFEEKFFRPKNETDITNWCGGTGCMLSIDPDGRLYPCIRYMESSLGDDAEPFYIGDVNEGIGQTDKLKERIKCLDCITRRSQSTDECFNCPIADGCSWCSAYNYQEFGTPDKRATYICDMHKTRSLANVYFWNKYYKLNNQNKVFKLWCPDDWALKIIDEDELNMLKELSKSKDETTLITNSVEVTNNTAINHIAP